MRRILLICLVLAAASCGDGGGATMTFPDLADPAEDTAPDPVDVVTVDVVTADSLLIDGVDPEDTPTPEDTMGPDLPACLGGGSCDDGDECTEDLCDPVLGCTSAPLSGAHCDDGNPCTDDHCDPAVGCVNAWNLAPCDDGDACTSWDSCLAGICRGTLHETESCAYAQPPSLGVCTKGSVTGSAKAEAMASVNQVRALSGLPPVTYDYGGDGQVQAAALLMAANGALSHFPPQSWSCWTQAGYDGAGSSNLHMNWSSGPLAPKPPSEAVVGFLIDWDVPSLGHRRWLLDPFLPSVSWGASGGYVPGGGDWPYVWAGVLQVMKDGAPNLSGLDLDFVAYPVGDYPAEWFETDWYLSFSALVDKASAWGNSGVSYANAQVKVTGPGGTMTVYDISFSSEYYGLPNHLQWRVVGLQAGVTYAVEITGVKDGGQVLGYEYEFILN